MTVYIECRISFGEAFRLSFSQCLSKLHAILAHARENVVARAVENAIEVLDLIADQSISQSTDDRNAAANAGFKPQANFLQLGGLHQAEAV